MVGAPQLISQMLIGSDLVAETSLGSIPHVNCATGLEQAEVLLASEQDVDAAVQAARKAAPAWSSTPPNERRDLLLRVATLIDTHAAELAAIGVAENGTPSAFAELACATFPAEYFRYVAGWCEKIHGVVTPVYPHRGLDYVVREPFGVVAAIVPWNGPMGLISMKVPAALAAGNTVVLKPSELAPFSALRLGQLFLEAGFPPGAVNVITGDARAGHTLVSHPGVDRISFTGGTATGRRIMATAAERVTPLSLELGGKSASIVFADADLDQAAAIAVRAGIAMQSGQACMAPTRLLVERSVYHQVATEVVGLAEDLEVGDPLDPATIMGPLITAASCNRVMDLISRASHDGGARLATGGERLGGTLANGFYVAPTVFVDVDPDSILARTEVFGPVLSVLPFDTEDEAVQIANATDFGLAGFVYTSDLRRAHRVAARLEAGYVGVNTFPLLPPPAPFGGYKQSGFGRELGAAGVEEFTRSKNVYIDLE